GDEGDHRKKMVSVPARRVAVAYATGKGLSQRRACTLLGVGRSALHYCSTKQKKDPPVLGAVAGLAAPKSRYCRPPVPGLPWPRRSCDELWTCTPSVASGPSSSTAQASEKAYRNRPPAAERADRRQPGVVVRLRVRLVCQRSAVEVPDRHRRMDKRGSRDRGR